MRLEQNHPKLRELFTEHEIKEAINNPYIIHYADKIKPWDNPDIFMGRFWTDVSTKTDYRNSNVDKYRLELEQWWNRSHKKPINLTNPKTFNEKIQWLKLFASTPDKTRLADKYLVRDWVAEKIGDKYLIPLLGVYDSFDEIDFEKLPKQFVIKCNHGSGWNMVVADKSKFDIMSAKKKFDMWMSRNFAFAIGCELHYRDIPPKIIIEEFVSNDGKALWDYKFWCFGGEVKYMQFRDDFSADLKMVFYDMDWNKQPFYYDHPLYDKELEKPDNFDEMVSIAKKLCQGFEFVCVDLYRLNNGDIKFGEMTFTRSSGTGHWNHDKYNKMLGKMIKLPKLAYNIDTGEYYKLPRIKKQKKAKTPRKKINIKPYLLFPYYLIAGVVMKGVLLPIKRRRVARQHLFDMANDYKNLKNTVVDLRNQNNTLKNQVAELKNAIGDARAEIQQIANQNTKTIKKKK